MSVTRPEYYIFAADLLCADCGESEIARQCAAGTAPEVDCRRSGCGAKFRPTVAEYRNSLNHAGWVACRKCGDNSCAWDEYSFDSDEFPKGELNDPEQREVCACCEETFGPEPKGAALSEVEAE